MLGSGRDDEAGAPASTRIRQKAIVFAKRAKHEAQDQASTSRTGLSQVQVGNIIRGKRGITAETALRLERALGMSAQTWMNLQTLYELEKASTEAGHRIKQTTARLKLREAA
jgi:addiction module HigA family antidote